MSMAGGEKSDLALWLERWGAILRSFFQGPRAA